MSLDSYNNAILQALTSRFLYQGQITFPCVPGALDHYVSLLADLFEKMGKRLAPHEISSVRNLLDTNLRYGYRRGAGTQVFVQYEITRTVETMSTAAADRRDEGKSMLMKNLGIRIGLNAPTLTQQFQSWSKTGGDSLFGNQADARVMAEVALITAEHAAVLDVGAGQGRNALAIARKGFPVDALDMNDEFCSLLEKAAKAENLPVRVIHGDLLDSRIMIPTAKYALAIACEVVSHFRYGSSLRTFMTRMCQALQTGGRLLLNIFLPRGNYEPDALAREMSEVAWSTLFTRHELDEAVAGLPLQMIGDDSVHDYERAHLPPDAWPPTGWFDTWSRGLSIFPFVDGSTPPVEMRWLLWEKTSST